MPAATPLPTHAVGVRATTLWRSPDVVRPLDAPMVATSPDPRAWAAGQDRAARLGLDGVADTQLLLGEPVVLLEEQGDWAYVLAPWQPSQRDPRGYPGWVPRAHVAALPEAGELEAVVVSTTAAVLRARGGEVVVDDVSYATILPVAGSVSRAGVPVHLPGGGEGWLDSATCAVREARRDHPVEAAAVLEAARRFVGLHYLWGGMCAFGLDCSGLVHIAFRACGLLVPRDAKDQAAVASEVPLDKVEAGDLLFFAHPGKDIHHVGFATGDDGVLLHAPGTGNPVEEAPLSDKRKATLTSAGRLTV